MALIKCVECGKEISDKATACPNCGCPVGDVKSVGTAKKKMDIPKNKKDLLVVGGVAILLVLLLALSKVMGGGLNENEKIAYECAVELRDMMKNPDSFKLYDDEMTVLKRYADGELITVYTVFKYGGTNTYGGFTTDEAIFEDGEYRMDYAEELDIDEEGLEEYALKTFLREAIRQGMSADKDDEKWERIDINVAKIRKEMGIE